MNNISSHAYMSPSQNREQCEAFCDSLDILMNNIKSQSSSNFNNYWRFQWKMLKVVFFVTSDNTGKEFDTITLTAGYTQIIDKPTHFTNHSSSCTYLIFTSNPSIIVDSGIEKFLCSSCHHDVYGKIIFRVPLPLAHFRTIWDYKYVGASCIQHAIQLFNT